MEIETLYKSNLRVLKWVNYIVFDTVHCRGSCNESDLGVEHKGLEMSQFRCKTCKGLERSQYTLLHRVLKGVNFGWNVTKCRSSCSQFPHRVLKEVQRLMLKVGMTFCRPISPSCMMQGVKSLEVGLPVLCQVLLDGVMGATWCRMFG